MIHRQMTPGVRLPVDPDLMTDDAINEEGQAIVDKFQEASAGDPYGWDWPTMYATFPDEVTRYRALRDEWKKRHPA